MRFLLLIFFMISILLANDYADWETITDMNEVHDIAFDENLAWVATSGGIYSYNLSDSQITRYTNLDGLSSINNNTLEIDDHGYIIAGGSDGILEFYSKETNKWSQLTVLIENSISDILYINDTLWVAAGKGIAVIPWNGSEYVFKDFYKNFDVIPNRVTKIAYFMKKIWLGTDKGLLSAPTDINKYTLNDPENWDIYDSSDGIVNNSILDLNVIDNILWIGTNRGISTINSQLEIRVESAWGTEEGDGAESIFKSGDVFYIANNYERTNPTVRRYRLYSFVPGSGRTLKKSFNDQITCINENISGDLWVGIDNDGIYQPEKDNFFKLDGPGENAVRYVIKDSDNNIWASSGKFAYTPNEGFFLYNGDLWQNIDFRGTGWGGLGNTDIIYEDDYNNVWLGTWGGGVMVYRNDLFEYFHSYESTGYMDITTYEKSKSIELDEGTVIYSGYFSGIPSIARYEVIGTIGTDLYSRLWITNYWSAKSNRLVAIIPYTSDGFVSLNIDDWLYFGTEMGIKNTQNNQGDISCVTFDDFFQAYLGTFSDGLHIINYQDKNTVSKVKHLTVQDNLYDSRIISVKKDQDGIIWIGTASGLNSYDGINLYRHPGDVNGLSGPLGNQINQIFVDEANNKWFATSGGLSILRGGRSPWDSTAWIGFTKENSGLVGNMVNTVFVDPDYSEALIGTESGLSIYRGDFAEIRQEYDKMAAGPNPFIIGKATNKFIIKNLIYNSEVKIFTLNGQLVRVLNANTGNVDGGRAEWDGRDSNGKLVSSGVYLFFSYSENGKSKAGKVAVIRD